MVPSPFQSIPSNRPVFDCACARAGARTPRARTLQSDQRMSCKVIGHPQVSGSKRRAVGVSGRSSGGGCRALLGTLNVFLESWNQLGDIVFDASRGDADEGPFDGVPRFQRLHTRIRTVTRRCCAGGPSRRAEAVSTRTVCSRPSPSRPLRQKPAPMPRMAGRGIARANQWRHRLVARVPGG